MVTVILVSKKFTLLPLVRAVLTRLDGRDRSSQEAPWQYPSQGLRRSVAAALVFQWNAGKERQIALSAGVCNLVGKGLNV
jgi:hypothetical protein